jgi:hypothetical protein
MSFLDLGARWRVIIFTLLPLYPRGKSPRYPLDRRLSEPRNRHEQRGEAKNLAPTGTQNPNPRLSSQ